MAERKLKKSDFVRIFLRSLFMQAVWNFKSLLSVGISFALVPVARRLADTPEAQVEVLRRHLYFFNAHPYFASFAIGALARLEEDYANGRLEQPEQIDRFRNALIGPLGAVGDLVFWNTVKPATILTGLAGVILAPNLPWKIIAVVVTLLLYNVPHFHIRIKGLLKGYERGYQIYKSLKIERFRRVRRLYRSGGAVMLGVVSGSLLGLATEISLAATSVFLGAGAVVYLLTERKLGMQFAILLAMVFAILIGMI